MSCQSCVFFTNENFMGIGQCWRYPPTPIAIVSGNGSGSLITTEVKSRYPEAHCNHWCGEFQSKDS